MPTMANGIDVFLSVGFRPIFLFSCAFFSFIFVFSAPHSILSFCWFTRSPCVRPSLVAPFPAQSTHTVPCQDVVPTESWGRCLAAEPGELSSAETPCRDHMNTSTPSFLFLVAVTGQPAL